mmetsp:Transcript_53132/g.126405  ORF Transcript_53132/g.126405 Transcript_53132/m.126405 type:complete len:585 (+) Transcript_53132:1012-2766(+)
MYGSLTKERKKSTVWIEARPSGSGNTTAQSSGLSRPTITPFFASSANGACSRSLARTREREVAPTLAPHPPHRIAACESVSSASAPAARATCGRASVGGAMIGRRVVYPAIHVRSIQSFSSHSHAPSNPSPPRDATHSLVCPVPMIPRKDSCGIQSSRRVAFPSRSLRRMLRASGGPPRTAKTPAFGRGWPTMEQMSPTANTSGELTDSSVGWTRTKPAESRVRPVSFSQPCAPADVHQMHSSHAMKDPSEHTRLRPHARSTSFPRWTVMPLSPRIRAKAARAAGECSGMRVADRETSETLTVRTGAPRATSSRWRRACIERASSTPPAPPPTTTRSTVSGTVLLRRMGDETLSWLMLDFLRGMSGVGATLSARVGGGLVVGGRSEDDLLGVGATSGEDAMSGEGAILLPREGDEMLARGTGEEASLSPRTDGVLARATSGETRPSCTDDAPTDDAPAGVAGEALAGGFPAVPPAGVLRFVARSHTRLRMVSHLPENPSIGFTGVTVAALVATPPFSAFPSRSIWASCGAEPMLMERTSYGMSGRPFIFTTFFSRSIPIASACTRRTPPKLASFPRSMWHSSRV